MEGTFESVYLRLEWHMTTVTFSQSVDLERMQSSTHRIAASWDLGSAMWSDAFLGD